MNNINDLLDQPDKLLALSQEELKDLLKPYFPAARVPLMPPEKAQKQGVEKNVFNQLLASMRPEIDALRKLKAQQNERPT